MIPQPPERLPNDKRQNWIAAKETQRTQKGSRLDAKTKREPRINPSSIRVHSRSCFAFFAPFRGYSIFVILVSFQCKQMELGIGH
jgi:hypothetical protein